jgi:hypothetical protein
VAQTLEIDQGPYDSVDNSAPFVGQREAIAIAANLRSAKSSVAIATAHRTRSGTMPDDPEDVVEAAIRSAFVSYPKEDDPDWRSPHWIKPEECAHFAKVVMLELGAKGFQIVKKAT